MAQKSERLHHRGDFRKPSHVAPGADRDRAMGNLLPKNLQMLLIKPCPILIDIRSPSHEGDYQIETLFEADRMNSEELCYINDSDSPAFHVSSAQFRAVSDHLVIAEEAQMGQVIGNETESALD
jgi:hypothetical protein